MPPHNVPEHGNEVDAGNDGHDPDDQGAHDQHGGESPLEALVNMSKKAQRLEDTAVFLSSQAYLNSLQSLLLNDDGEVDYSRLDAANVRQQFADSMMNAYKGAAEKVYGIKFDTLDEFRKDDLMFVFSGFRRHELAGYMDQYRSGFTIEVMGQLSAQKKTEKERQYRQTVTSKIKEEDIASIVAGLKIGDQVDATKMRPEDLGPMVYQFAKEGMVPKSLYEGAPFYKGTPTADHAAENGHAAEPVPAGNHH